MEQRIESFSGPLPHPDVLGAYDTLVENGAERVFQMAERQATHRQELERIAVTGQDHRATRGQTLGFVLALVVLILGTAMVFGGYPIPGTTLIGLDLVSLVGAFIYGTSQQGRDLRGKRQRRG